MSCVLLPKAAQVIWQLDVPRVAPYHSYFEVPDKASFDRLQAALAERGLPKAHLLPQYWREEDGIVVAIGGCVCHNQTEHPALALLDFIIDPVRDRVAACAKDASIEISGMSSYTLADYFHIPSDGRLLYADLYHWDPWQHEWRLEEVNSVLLRYGLPARKGLSFTDGRRILCVLGIYKQPGGLEVKVRYAIAEACGKRAYTCDVAYDQSHDVLVCLSAGGRIAVRVSGDEMRENETWRFLTHTLDRKPTNEALHERIMPWLPTAQLSVSSLGTRKVRDRGQALRLLRVPVTSEAFEERQVGFKPGFTWKTWREVKAALERGVLDPDTEVMVIRILRRFKNDEELFCAT